ncbi:type VII secretion target [Amycolatopsis saalfeldensis]|uniref:Excreted virulence factor EspC, type VII ESX diderm n=1 Tax=Amycolatopsis saalfeldensis TaxID=394193 RepID=A0A1H8XIY9_9PSEU|nr:type VII secretion target [Amycolatopsis saalfeldensis]SEP39248.1 Excreted virulence factor EspC, type VII ESX diderm [Amycolatopsis saalfeldensis]
MTAPGGSGFEVQPEELRKHAAAVQRVAASLGQALSAAEQVTMGVDVYGLICGPLFVPIVLAVSAPGLITLQQSKSTLESIPPTVEQAAATYEKADLEHATTMSKVGSKLS